MERAAQSLGRVARRLGRPEAALAWLAGAWPSVVGKALAAHTRPVRCVAGCLEIATDSDDWQRQLEAMAREFGAQINEAWGGYLIRQVKFVPAKSLAHPSDASARRLPYELDNDHTPFLRRRKP